MSPFFALIALLAIPALLITLYDIYLHYWHKAIPFYLSPYQWKKITLVCFFILIINILHSFHAI